MVTKLDMEQNNVFALRIEGKLDHKAFMEVAKDLEEEFDRHDHFRLYLEVPHLEGVEFRVLWDSLAFALSHLRDYIRKIDRIAVVCDDNWLRRFTEIENKLVPGIAEKAYSFEEKEQAIDWIREFTPDLTM
jgi:hypothetical protein